RHALHHLLLGRRRRGAQPHARHQPPQGPLHRDVTVLRRQEWRSADQAATAGWSIGCMVRKPTQIRFQTLIVPIATVMLAISLSVNCTFSASKASSGAPVPAMFVTASTQPSRARSRGV